MDETIEQLKRQRDIFLETMHVFRKLTESACRERDVALARVAELQAEIEHLQDQLKEN